MPILGNEHVDAALTDFALAYVQAADSFVSSQVFPTIPSAKQSDKYHTFDKDYFLRSEAQKRARNTESAGRHIKVSQGSFFCDVFSVHQDVSEQDKANADFDAEEAATRAVMQDLMIRKDMEWATAAFSTGVWGTDSTGGGGTWNSTGDPIVDITTAIRSVEQETGFRPNTLVLGSNAWYQGLMNSTKVINRLPDNAPRIATPTFIGNLFDLDRVFVAKAIRTTSAEGSTAASTEALILAGDQALLCYVDPNAGPFDATAGITFTWDLPGDGLQNGIRMKTYDMPWQDALPRVEGDFAVDHKVVASDLGYLLHTVVT